MNLPFALVIAAALTWPAQAHCIDEAAPEAPPPLADADASPGGTRLAMNTMVREAIARSQAVGAARLLADAARDEVNEARAGALPQATLSGSVGPSVGRVNGESDSGTRAAATVSIGAPLYDGGRIAELTGWRAALAEAARQGSIDQEEQISLQTVSLALERGRYRLQDVVYRQYARKMACLVDLLQAIVDGDKGRGSELVQARKTLQQVELSVQQTESVLRQVEVRLARFVGPELAAADAPALIAPQIAAVSPMGDLLAEADRASEIAQLQAQADALDSYSRAVAATRRPQIGWNANATAATGTGTGTRSTSLGAGVTLSVPLLDPGIGWTIAAAQKRAGAARRSAEDALEARHARIREAYEQAAAAFDRADDVVDVLKNSDRVRNDTLQQWRRIGRRSLFDVMSAESDHYGLRIAYVNALLDAQQSTALLWSLGLGVSSRLQ